jgi:hypothetical protein
VLAGGEVRATAGARLDSLTHCLGQSRVGTVGTYPRAGGAAACNASIRPDLEATWTRGDGYCNLGASQSLLPLFPIGLLLINKKCVLAVRVGKVRTRMCMIPSSRRLLT